MHVAAPKGPAARARESQRSVAADGHTGLVDRSEFAEVLVRLLQVIAEDCLEFLAAVALRVDLVGPLHELGVHGRAGALEQSVVNGVADQVVIEAITRVGAIGDGWPDEMLAGQRLQLVTNLVAQLLRRQ